MPHFLPDFLMMPESLCVEKMVQSMDWNDARAARVAQKSVAMVEAMRGQKRKAGSLENFFQTYGLNTQEGISLMCLAEALLRIPDTDTAHALIRDKITQTEWGKGSDDWLLKLAGLGLSASKSTLQSPLSSLGAPVIRKAMMDGMKVLGGQFVLGQSMEDALQNASKLEQGKGYLFSFDMLGEGARTQEDAQHYFEGYSKAIEEIGVHFLRKDGKKPGISVKLSALHPRFCAAQDAQCVPDLINKLTHLCRRAAALNINLTVDAEESERLETSLKIITPIIEDISLSGWDGFGLAVQAYGKRCVPLVENLVALAQQNSRRIQIRLVKGAYWDSEIKRAQIKGLEDYPVFTRKIHTDISYLACAQILLRGREWVYPMFGTHNAYTVQAVLEMAGTKRDGFEFQRLFGMGDALYDQVLKTEKVHVRIYAPVGVHKDLLPYLVRRLLENGANSSFVNKVFDVSIAPAELCKDPVEQAMAQHFAQHPSIPLPAAIFENRTNSAGLDLDDAPTLQSLLSALSPAYDRREVVCASIIGGRLEKTGNFAEIRSPSSTQELVGTAYYAHEALVEQAFVQAQQGFGGWNATPAQDRADILNKVADLFESHTADLVALCVHEAGKTLADALSEVREAVDFCRYYAAQGRELFDENGQNLRSYTGESNNIMLQGRGVFVCISPWNFPLAIFTGQVVAALMAGNSVLAKPAEQTPFIAQLAVTLMHKAGVPKNVLHLVIGDGRVGEMLTSHALAAGVAFTGSTGAAQSINRTLAGKDGAIVPLIAETGGQNAIVADSSALPEQLVDDVVLSAFGSAGQRCSAARILFVQQDIADKVITMLQGAMENLKVGHPQYYATDIGPVIDEEALAMLTRHKSMLDSLGRKIAQAPLSKDIAHHGHYFAPVAYEISDLSILKGEVFGPILHVVRFGAGQMAAVLKALNDTEYGLTFGIHSRIDSVVGMAAKASKAGNVYVNRSIIGAVVGVQPFGGNGLSGTGPKAGGPHYLARFACEKVISTNTTAAGGNASLVMLGE